MTALVAKITAALENANVLMFSDFNYGCLPQPLVDRLRMHCIERGIMMTADSQASSQFGDVSRFKCTNVLTPTEYEARLAMRDSQSGLAVLAERLRQEAKADHVVVTLAKEGVLIQSWDHSIGTSITDRIPAFNTSPKDVTGAGDSLFTCVSLALAAGADIWRSAYLGSVAAALQVSRVGNQPITRDSLVAELGP
jgi:bifunctional ADP-heptose synthase (sugar kinase/adenylyltransferase)